jgi:hypothetical protein
LRGMIRSIGFRIPLVRKRRGRLRVGYESSFIIRAMGWKVVGGDGRRTGNANLVVLTLAHVADGRRWTYAGTGESLCKYV